MRRHGAQASRVPLRSARSSGDEPAHPAPAHTRAPVCRLHRHRKAGPVKKPLRTTAGLIAAVLVSGLLATQAVGSTDSLPAASAAVPDCRPITPTPTPSPTPTPTGTPTATPTATPSTPPTPTPPKTPDNYTPRNGTLTYNNPIGSRTSQLANTTMLRPGDQQHPDLREDPARHVELPRRQDLVGGPRRRAARRHRPGDHGRRQRRPGGHRAVQPPLDPDARLPRGVQRHQVRQVPAQLGPHLRRRLPLRRRCRALEVLHVLQGRLGPERRVLRLAQPDLHGVGQPVERPLHRGRRRLLRLHEPHLHRVRRPGAHRQPLPPGQLRQPDHGRLRLPGRRPRPGRRPDDDRAAPRDVHRAPAAWASATAPRSGSAWRPCSTSAVRTSPPSWRA